MALTLLVLQKTLINYTCLLEDLTSLRSRIPLALLKMGKRVILNSTNLIFYNR